MSPTTRPEGYFEVAEAAAAEVRRLTGVDRHDVAIVLGSGWQDAVDELGTTRVELSTADLPGFAAPTVAGHHGRLRSMEVGHHSALVVVGRVHLYEGRTPGEVVHPVRTAVLAGAATVVLTNAAGGVDPVMRPGQAVLISDHINLTGASPLAGPPPPEGYGSRFVDLTDLYSRQLRTLAHEVDPSLAEAVYAALPGPHYETPAEVEMVRRAGAGLVGMSTALEAIAARHLGASVLGISLVTNLAAGVSAEPLDHAEVLAAGAAASPGLARLVKALVSEALTPDSLEVSDALRARVEAWIAVDPDPATRDELLGLLAASDAAALEDRFAHPLLFGTAGLRGALGAGPARMNRVVVRRTTVGVAAWVLEQGPGAAAAGVVVGRDGRHGSEAFAVDVAAIAGRAGLRVRSFARPLPTPITAFAVRHLRTTAGVMITASHNPAADNGYKVYLSDGAQVLPPHDAAIAEAASTPEAAARAGETWAGGPVGRSVEPVDEQELIGAYHSAVLALLDPAGPRDLAVVYTPLHGMGGAVLPDLLEQAGFRRPRAVPAQAQPDPDFPTLPFPNPEEPGALDLAIAEAERHGADIVLANDPDADRLAVAVPRREGGGWQALSGDELGILLADHLIDASEGDDRLVATTIVSSSMLSALAAERGVAYVETLTGFKWVARAASRHPGHRLLFGYEEALGYAVCDAVADKDGMSAAAVAAEMAALARAGGGSLLDRLDDLAARLGVHATSQWSLRLDGSDAPARMAAIVARWRSDPPASLAGMAVTESVDLAHGTPELAPTDAVVVRAGGRARVVVRPSGTEPKLKAYLEVTTAPPGREGVAEARRDAGTLLDALREDVARLCSEG